jgi:hypothetical protein
MCGLQHSIEFYKLEHLKKKKKDLMVNFETLKTKLGKLVRL